MIRRTLSSRCRLRLAALGLVSSLGAQAPTVTATGETMRLQSASVGSSGAGAFTVTLVVADDNGNAALPTSFRRWWHCEIGNLGAAGALLDVTVDSRSGYSDQILPVWARSSDGVTFGAYERCPPSAAPQYLGSGRHRFALAVPAGTVAIRLAKYFPYTVADKDGFLAGLAGDPRVQVQTIGSSVQGRPIQRLRLTDPSVPDAGKVGVWIHAGIHPAETTSYFTVEGLVAWLRSPDPLAAALLDRAIVDIVPMANPDGVALGNYRTNANSRNLENEWAAPYNSSQPEIVALRTQIEQAMGSVAAPAGNPLEVVLNLHSSHNVAFPFHFQHASNPGWSPGATGVIPLVHQIEGQWIGRFRQRSPFVARGSTLVSSAGYPSRPYVESMMHDRWTAVPGWLPPAGTRQPVMAITFEGTYGRGPDGIAWNTPADYRLCGAELGRALADHLGVALTASVQPFGAPCAGAWLSAALVPQPDNSHLATLTLVGAPSSALGWLALGFQQTQAPLPAPWQSCDQLVVPFATGALNVNFLGIGQATLALPPWPGLQAHFQAVTLDAGQGTVATSNGLTLRNDY